MAIRNQYTDLFDGGYYQDIAKFRASKKGVVSAGSRYENTDFDIREDNVKRKKLNINEHFNGCSQSKKGN